MRGTADSDVAYTGKLLNAFADGCPSTHVLSTDSMVYSCGSHERDRSEESHADVAAPRPSSCHASYTAPSSGKGPPCAVLLTPKGRRRLLAYNHFARTGGIFTHLRARLAHPPSPQREGGGQWPDRHVDSALSASAWQRDVCNVGALRHPVAPPPYSCAGGK